jgi:hypothetical protein
MQLVDSPKTISNGPAVAREPAVTTLAIAHPSVCGTAHEDAHRSSLIKNPEHLFGNIAFLIQSTTDTVSSSLYNVVLVIYDPELDDSCFSQRRPPGHGV